MKLNNKGTTLVEIIVSISLISIVLVFLFRLLLVVKDMDDKSLSQLEYEEKSSLVMKTVQDELTRKEATDCTYNSSTITCESTNTKIKITPNNSAKKVTVVISNADDTDSTTKTFKYPDGASIGNIESQTLAGGFKLSISVQDDKDNNYPIEIVYIGE